MSEFDSVTALLDLQPLKSDRCLQNSVVVNLCPIVVG